MDETLWCCSYFGTQWQYDIYFGSLSYSVNITYVMAGGDFSWKCETCILQWPIFWATLQNFFVSVGIVFLALVKLWTFFKYFEKFISFLSCCERPYIKLFTLKCCNMVKAVRLTVNHDTALGIWFSACNSFQLPQFGRKLTVVRRLRFTSMNYTNVYHYKIKNTGFSRLKL